MSMRLLYVLGVILAYAALFVTGRKLRGYQRGTGGVLLSAHKLVSVCAFGLVGLVTYRASVVSAFGAGEWAAAVAAGACWLVSAASGGITASSDAPQKALRTVHRTASALAVVTSAVALAVSVARV